MCVCTRQLIDGLVHCYLLPQASAAAFAKGLLDLEGTSLTPILVSLVGSGVILDLQLQLLSIVWCHFLSCE